MTINRMKTSKDEAHVTETAQIKDEDKFNQVSDTSQPEPVTKSSGVENMKKDIGEADVKATAKSVKADERKVKAVQKAEKEKFKARKTDVKTVKSRTKETKTESDLKINTIKQTLYIQYSGREVEERVIIERIKEVWVSKLDRKLKDILDIKAYVKIEENAVYFVINDEVSGRIDL